MLFLFFASVLVFYRTVKCDRSESDKKNEGFIAILDAVFVEFGRSIAENGVGLSIAKI